MSDSINEIDRLLGIAENLTIGQWIDLHSSSTKRPEVRLWLGVLHQAILDWKRHAREPQNLILQKNALDIPDWIKSDSASVELVMVVVESLLGITENRFREALNKFVLNQAVK